MFSETESFFILVVVFGTRFLYVSLFCFWTVYKHFGTDKYEDDEKNQYVEGEEFQNSL